MNPLYQTNDSPNGATQPTKAVNRQGVFVARSHNTFDMSYFNYKTQHYGTLEPFFVMEGVAGDKIPLSSSHDVRTFPMSSPFLSSLKLNKDYFMIPIQSIMPSTWELIFKNPSQGSDVPDDAYCSMNLYTLLQKLLDNIYQLSDSLVAGTVSENDKFVYLMSVLALDTVYSSGSLLSSLGFNTSLVVQSGDASVSMTLNDYIDFLYSKLTINSFSLLIDGVTYNYTISGDNIMPQTVQVTKAQMISLLRDYLPYAKSFVMSIEKFNSQYQLSSKAFNRNFDLSRVFAYQIACYQYYVNPQVDFIYNSQIWRDNLFALLRNCYEGTMPETPLTIDSFLYNGVTIPYDFCSNHYLSAFISWYGSFVTEVDYIKHLQSWYTVLNYIFGYNHALRFGDYFTDSRTRPYAPGDMNAPVVGNNVSAIDITKSISMQRFLNSVVKLGNNFGDYLRGIFGTTPSPDYHFPKFISHQEFDISGFEVANTSDTQQGSLVTNLKSADDRFAFEVEVDMPCIIMGISSFVMPSVYSQTIDRHYFHSDRFDMFNPMLQFIGDQEVYPLELGSYYNSKDDQAFGYQSRFAEYKQRYSVAAGGFVDKLPAWAYVVDKPYGNDRNILPFSHQSPYFIRCTPSDFNRFLVGIPGNSLAHDFHFIVVYNNKCVCNRPMEVNPNIL